MTEALALEILRLVVQYGPTAEASILGLIKGGKTLLAGANGVEIPDSALQAVAAAIATSHTALPKPTV